MTSHILLRRTAHLGAALLLVGGLAACGDDEPDPDAGPSSTEPSGSTGLTESPEPTETEPAVERDRGGLHRHVVHGDRTGGWALDARSPRVAQFNWDRRRATSSTAARSA